VRILHNLMPNPTLDLASFEKALRERVRGTVSFDEATRGVYATDASIYQITPVAVVTPEDEADVRAAVKTAAEYGVSILPRGGGTSLAGQTVGASLVLDFSRNMNKILELNVEERWVRVQPGVVRDELNAEIARHGLHFAPDPATANRANIGGMIGNNTSGTKSIIYGKTIDHVIESRVLLADGDILTFKELSPEEYATRAQGAGREAKILRETKRIIGEQKDEIKARYPKVMRRVQGYMLDEFIDTDRWNLSKLITGSEGTLCILLEAKLNLEPIPKYAALCLLHFADLLETMRAVEPIVAHNPSAVEILDRTILELALKNLTNAPFRELIRESPAAVLIVEFYGDTQEEAEEKVGRMAADIRERGFGYAHPVHTNPTEMEMVWELRKNGLGLMLGIKGDRKPTPFIEDAAVPVSVLPEYIDHILKFCKEMDRDVAMYAHASVGLIHVRPILDLSHQEDIDKMKAIADRAFELVVGYGGSWSGEHGDGIVRSGYLERYFGASLYNAFREIKQLFDPEGLMNPGKIIDPPPMDNNLRFGTDYKTISFPNEFKYRDDGTFFAAVEMCTGVGACRKSGAGTMCPSYMATRQEQHSTRGRANALRLAMTGQLGMEGMKSRELFDVLDLCLSCKACKSECPSNVDMAKLKSEFLQQYRDTNGITLRDRMIGGSAEMAERLSGWKAPVMNWLQNTTAVKKIVESSTGFDSRRCMPGYASQTLTSWFANRSNPNGRGRESVVLFADTYINFYEPYIGKAAVELLESCGYKVILARPGCCQRPRISHGLLRDAKAKSTATISGLDEYLLKGMKVVVCEPSCCSALNDDWPDLVEDEALASRLKENIMMIDVFLANEINEGRLDCKFTSIQKRVLIHGHCHQKALYGTIAMKEILGRVDGLEVNEVDSGCCGMAGSFGYEKEHYEISKTIAEDRLLPAIRNKPEGTEVIACGFSCRHQIADFAGEKALHWVETLRGIV